MILPSPLGRFALALSTLLVVASGCIQSTSSTLPAAGSGRSVSPSQVFIYRSTIPEDFEQIGQEHRNLGQGMKLDVLFEEIRATAAEHGANVALIVVTSTAVTNYEIVDTQDGRHLRPQPDYEIFDTQDEQLRVRPQPVAHVRVLVSYGYSPNAAFGGLVE